MLRGCNTTDAYETRCETACSLYPLEGGWSSGAARHHRCQQAPVVHLSDCEVRAPLADSTDGVQF